MIARDPTKGRRVFGRRRVISRESELHEVLGAKRLMRAPCLIQSLTARALQ